MQAVKKCPMSTVCQENYCHERFRSAGPFHLVQTRRHAEAACFPFLLRSGPRHYPTCPPPDWKRV